MTDRDKQFKGSNSPQDLGEPAPGIPEADKDATGWDLRSLEDVRDEEEVKAAEESTRRQEGADRDKT